MVQSIGRRYVQYFNHIYSRTGTLWEGRYKSTLVDTDNYLLTVYRYIELNPVRAGMVEHATDYPWSSYPHNAAGVDIQMLEFGVRSKINLLLSYRDACSSNTQCHHEPLFL
jgi:putative transposase